MCNCRVSLGEFEGFAALDMLFTYMLSRRQCAIQLKAAFECKGVHALGPWSCSQLRGVSTTTIFTAVPWMRAVPLDVGFRVQRPRQGSDDMLAMPPDEGFCVNNLGRAFLDPRHSNHGYS